MRKILHVKVGGDGWEPTVEDLEFVNDLFSAANSDPQGAVISTSHLVDSELVDVQESDDIQLTKIRVTAIK